MKDLLFELMKDEMLAYAYLFGRDGGCPLLFTDKGDNKNSVNSYNNRWKELYKNPEIIKMLHFHNQTHGSDMKFVYVD
jgi:alpha-amylase